MQRMFGKVMMNKVVKYGFLGLIGLCVFAVFITLSSCESNKSSQVNSPKDSTDNVTTGQKAFDLLVLGKPFIMKSAIDSSGLDVTNQFADQIYYLDKQTYTNGPARVVVNGITYNGFWDSNDDYSKLVLRVSGLKNFEFFSIPWRITNKTFTGLSLIPQSGNAGAKQMELQKKQ